MDHLIALYVLIGVLVITQSNPLNDIGIVRFENYNNGGDGYNYVYEGEDGTTAQEQGYFKNNVDLAAEGSYSFTSPDGQVFFVKYTADENGFVPQGSHIPTPPPIPEAILKALEQNRIDEENGIFDDGQYHPEKYN